MRLRCSSAGSCVIPIFEHTCTGSEELFGFTKAALITGSAANAIERKLHGTDRRETRSSRAGDSCSGSGPIGEQVENRLIPLTSPAPDAQPIADVWILRTKNHLWYYFCHRFGRSRDSR